MRRRPVENAKPATWLSLARVHQTYTCHATGAAKVSFYRGNARWKSERSERLRRPRYPARLLISPRNPYTFFLTICTPPCSGGSCAAPCYPENKQSLYIPQIRYVRGAICSLAIAKNSRTVNLIVARGAMRIKRFRDSQRAGNRKKERRLHKQSRINRRIARSRKH